MGRQSCYELKKKQTNKQTNTTTTTKQKKKNIRMPLILSESSLELLFVNIQ